MQLSVNELKDLLKGARLDGRGDNVYAVCPKCGQNEFGISVKAFHRFGCFRKQKCGFNGNIFTLLAYLGKSWSVVKPGVAPLTQLTNKIEIINERKIDLELEDISVPLGWKRIYQDDYLDARGFAKDDYLKYKVGVTSIHPKLKDEYLVFLIEQYGGLKGYIGRSRRSKDEVEALNKYYKLRQINKKVLRYKNSETDFSKLLLGIDEVTEKTTTAFLVEGLFDKKNTDSKLGLDDQEEVKCLATFKCGVSPEQIYLLQQTGIRQIVLMYDPDVIDEIKKAAHELDVYFNVLVGFEESGLDPGDMELEHFDRMLDNLKTPSAFSTSKLHVRKLRKN